VSTPTHPPIPPNCPYFREPKSEDAWFEVPGGCYSSEEQEQVDGPLLSSCGHWCPIIAAVAQVAWLKLAKACEAKIPYPPSSKIPEMQWKQEEYNASRDLQLALNNAAAWERWSEGEQG